MMRALPVLGFAIALLPLRSSAQQPGRAAPDLLGDLVRHLETGHEDDARSVLAALSQVDTPGDDTGRRLIAALEPATDPLRRQILRTLGDLAPALAKADADAVLEWAEQTAAESALAGALLRFGDQKGKRVAPTELHRVQTRLSLRGAVGLDELLELLANDDVDTAELAAQRLARFGAKAERAVPLLVELMDAPVDSSIRFRVAGQRSSMADLAHLRSDAPVVAAAAIVAIAPGCAEALDAHKWLLREGSREQRLSSLIALRERADAPARVTAIVLPSLRQTDDRALRREALMTLSTLGRGAAAAAEHIEAIAEGEDAELAAQARAVLRSLRQR